MHRQIKIVAGAVTAGVVLEVSPDGGSIRVVEKPEGVHIVHTFWFAWASFHPDTDLFDPDP